MILAIQHARGANIQRTSTKLWFKNRCTVLRHAILITKLSRLGIFT